MTGYERYSRNIIKALDHIEKHISTQVSYKEAAAVAGMSESNFWRVFKMLFGTTIGSYIRERRLTLVARKLTGSRMKIVDICMEHGCDSPEIITRAFKKQFGVTPARYREEGKNRIYLERTRLSERTVRHILGGGISPNPRVERVRGFGVSGVTGSLTMKTGITAGLNLLLGLIASLRKVHGYKPRWIYFSGRMKKRGGFRAFEKDTVMKVTTGCDTKEWPGKKASGRVPGGKYAVYTHRGPLEMLLTSYQYAIGCWLRSKRAAGQNGYILGRVANNVSVGSMPEFEIYLPVK